MKKLLLITTAIAVCSATTFAQKKTDKKTTPAKAKTEKQETTATPPPAPAKPTVDYAALGFKKTESGLVYKFVNDAPGTNLPKLGDNVEVHINTHINDSMLFNSRVLNHGQPVGFTVMPPSFKGDLVEGLMLMTPGDSAVFLISVDSVQKSGAQLLPWMKSGDMIEYDVQMASVKSKEQVKAETETKSAAQKSIDDNLLQEYFKANKLKPMKTASGLYYVITKKGAGDLPKAGNNITVNYTGKTLNGVTFDSNVDSNFHHVQPFSFLVGQHQVISGWDEGLMLMNKGCKASLFIPSGLAYGERGAGEKIPANSILIFDVEVTKIAEDKKEEKN
jgi:FKBP-type peptidyl-prolyl cis-trans isomerase